jgi:hypothetical protein
MFADSGRYVGVRTSPKELAKKSGQVWLQSKMGSKEKLTSTTVRTIEVCLRLLEGL